MTLAIFESLHADKKQSFEAICIELRERFPWLWTPGFNVGAIEGYIPGVFGCRAGPHENLNVYNVLHEVSHAIELLKSEPSAWTRRLRKTSFGMRIKSYQTIGGVRYHEAETMQATQRECRVGAIQLHLLQAGGYRNNKFKNDFIETLKYMADSHLGGDSILNAHDPKKYMTGQKQWFSTRLNLIEHEYKVYTPESIKLAWAKVSHQLAKRHFKSAPYPLLANNDPELSI